MKPLKKIEKLVKKFSIDTNAETNELVLNELLEAQTKSNKAKLSSPQLNIRRITIKRRIIKFAAAAVIIIGVIVGVKVFTGRGEKPEETVVKQPDVPEKKDINQIVKDDKPDLDVKLETELGKIRQMVAAGDVDGLAAVLSNGEFEFESKVAAANYLAKIGDLSTIEALEKASDEWERGDVDNPFTAAIKEIKERVEQEEQEAEVVKSGEAKPEATSAVKEPAADAKETITYRGIVTNESDQAIEGVAVRSNLCLIRAMEFKGWEAEASTNGEGEFEIGPLVVVDNKKGSRTLLFEHPDYAIGWFSPYWGENRELDPNQVKVTLLEPAIVSGAVVDEGGNPIEGAMIEASLQSSFPRRYFYFDMSRTNNMAVITDADGRFFMDKIPEGARLHIYVSKKGYVRYSSREEYERSDMHPIRTGEDLQIVLEEGGVIKGRLVLNGEDYKKKDVLITVQGAGRGWAITDEGGQFEIIGLREGNYTVVADNDALAKENLVCPTQSNIEVKVAAVESYVKLKLQKGLPVVVQVIDEKSGEAVEKVAFSIKLQKNKDVHVSWGTTGDEGRCAVRLAPGEYTLSAQGWKNGQFHQFSKDFDVNAGSEDLTVEVAVTPRPFVYGWLVDVNDNLVRGTVILGHDKPIETYENGEFEIQEPWWHPGDIRIGYAFDAEKKLGRGFFWKPSDDANDLEIVLEPLTTIVGQVVDEDGIGVGDVNPKISILLGHGMSTSSSNKLWKMTIEPDGWFSFEGVPVGLPMKLFVEKPGYQGSAELPELKAGEVLEAGDVILKPLYGFEDGRTDWTGTISGRVMNENNEPMVGLRVWADGAKGVSQDVTDLEGRYKLVRLPRGKRVSGGVYAAGYGHSTFKKVIDGNDLDIQIFPQGWDLLDKEAPGLFVEKWLNTEPITLEQYRGKVVLLQIGVLLPNYLQEFDRIQKLLEKYGNKGLEVIAVHQHLSVTWAGEVTENDLMAFVKKHDVKFPFGIDDSMDRVRDLAPGRLAGNGAMYSLYDVKATPALYLIDKEGILRISPTRDNIDEWIKRLLEE